MPEGGGGLGPRGASAEKRRHIRVEVALEVVLSVSGEGEPSLYRAVTRDISHGGACLAVPDSSGKLFGRLAEGKLLDVGIDAGRAVSPARRGGAPVFFPGHVEWIRRTAEPGAQTLIGLAFHSLSPAEETAIIDLIAHILLAAGVALSPEARPLGQRHLTLCG